ncbi:MAG: M4 family metallopeptidase [Bacteroidetes bacterium]|nr:M4 family metallopeptidase [Bacteroidota bacterium]
MAKSQEFSGLEALKFDNNAEFVRVNQKTGNINYLKFKTPLNIEENNRIYFLRKLYNLSESYSISRINFLNDELGFEHIRYQIYFKNIPILGSVIIFHYKEKLLHSINGEIYKIEQSNIQLPLNEEKCFEKALEIIGAKSYKWQFEEEEILIKQIKNDSLASWFPKAELVFCPKDLNFDNKEFIFSYKFKIYSDEPLTAENIYIDAITNDVVARENLIHTTDVPGTAITKYSGTKAIVTDSTAPFNYRLRENSRGNGIYTLNLKKGTNYGLAVDFLDSNNVWNNINANKDEVATDAHWGAEMTYDYYLNVHNRKSYDNNNARIYSYVHYSNNYDNAFWNGVSMTYGDGNTFKPLTSIDVCGHEVSHAVTSNSANLVYSYESGALNESFSDIFGNSIERYARPSQYSWLIGEDITTSGTGLRNMQNPKAKNHPRCYKSTNWYSGAGDNGGVHTNSGVQNWWYYLITEGDTGKNDLSNYYSVDSLGIFKAEKIAYRNLTVYLTPSSKYADARFYSIRAAVDLFGNCSKEVIAVTNAWYACNVGPKYDSGFVKADFKADTIICNTSQIVNFENLSSNAIAYKWDFGDGSNSVVFNPKHNYSAFGNYSVKLVAYSCFQNKTDSITRSNYIKVDSSFDICNAVLMPQSGKDSISKCNSFVYDDGGENIYKQNVKTVLKIYVPGADSIVLKFFDFDYEKNYDSLYLYNGPYPGGIKIGGFTGNTIPFAGKNYKIAGNLITLVHKSDPMVTGRGFKMYYQAYKQPVKITAFKDTTICRGNQVNLYATGTGGYQGDFSFLWKYISHNDSISVTPDTTTIYKVSLTDVCTKSVDSTIVTITVKDSLKLSVSKDTTICIGQSVIIGANGNGGESAGYSYTWDNGLGVGNSHIVSPAVSTKYMVVLTDGCTVKNDTAYINITVRNKLGLNLWSNDTLICFNKSSVINATEWGGLSTGYNITWNNALGTGNSKTINLTNNTWIKATLTDGCNVIPASDSVLIVVRPELKISLNNDTTICTGTSVNLLPYVFGGDTLNYKFTWNNGLSAIKNQTVSPNSSTKYSVTLSDNCSDIATDSITVTLLAPLKLSNLKDTLICYGGKANFNPIASGGKPLQYQFLWDNGLGTLQNQIVSPLANTKYKLILKDNCTVIYDSAFVNVIVRNPLKLTSNLSKDTICTGDSSLLTFNITGGITSQYKSYLNGVQTFLNSIYLKPNSATIYKIKITDNCSNNDSTSYPITLNSLPIVDFTADKTEICRLDEVQFTNNSSNAVSYEWIFGTGDRNTVLSPKYQYKISGLFDVTLTCVSNQGCKNSIKKTSFIKVIELPVSDFNYTPTEITLADPTVIFNNNSSNYTNFEWDFGDLATNSSDANPIHTYSDKGVYKVKLISFNSLGCSDTIIKDIFIEDVYYLWVPNAFTPNNDGINDSLEIVSKGILTSVVKVFNRWGELVYETNLNSTPFYGKDNSGKPLMRGSYLVIIELRDFTKRFHNVRKVIQML